MFVYRTWREAFLYALYRATADEDVWQVTKIRGETYRPWIAQLKMRQG